MEYGADSWHMDDVLQPYSLDDNFEGFFSRNEGESILQATQDCDALFATDHKPQPFFPDLTDWSQDATPELGSVSPFPTELSLQHDLVGELNFNSPNIELYHDQPDWLDAYVDVEPQQFKPEHLAPPTYEATPELPKFAAEVSGEFIGTHTTPLFTSSDEHVDPGSRDGDGDPSPNSPSREEALRALEIVEKYFNSDTIRPLLKSYTNTSLSRLKRILLSPLKSNKYYFPSSEHDHGSKVGRATISISQNKALADLFSITPYPTADETEKCSAQTGLSAKTIKTWFANARNRNEGTQRTYICL
jgi:hypothetical protein